MNATTGKLIVKRDEPEKQSRGGIFIPDSAQSKTHTGVVVSVGLPEASSRDTSPGLYYQRKQADYLKQILEYNRGRANSPYEHEDPHKITCDFKEGDRVLYRQYSGGEFTHEDVDYIALKYDDILAVL